MCRYILLLQFRKQKVTYTDHTVFAVLEIRETIVVYL